MSVPPGDAHRAILEINVQLFSEAEFLTFGEAVIFTGTVHVALNDAERCTWPAAVGGVDSMRLVQLPFSDGLVVALFGGRVMVHVY